MNLIDEVDFMQPLAQLPHATAALALVMLLLLVAALASWLTRRVLLRVVARLAEASPVHWDNVVMSHNVLSRLAHLVPALVLYAGIGLVPALPGAVDALVRSVALAWMVLTVALALGNLLDALNEIYRLRGARARERPIKGYLQLIKLVVFVSQRC